MTEKQEGNVNQQADVEHCEEPNYNTEEKQEFNLSEKVICFSEDADCIMNWDVKEFIKRLKDELEECFTVIGTLPPKPITAYMWNGLLKDINEEIDKLAGKELLK